MGIVFVILAKFCCAKSIYFIFLKKGCIYSQKS